jgi:putative restriction endonuclease
MCYNCRHMPNNWNRDQLIVAFNLYCKIPFAKAVQTNPDVIKVATLIGRSPGAVAFKLGNFGSFDPELKKRGIGGLPNTSRLDKEIWDEFNSNWDELAYQSEMLVEKFGGKSAAETSDLDISDLPPGSDREGLVRIRVNQHFFRSAVLSIYGGKCCITGLELRSLLVASHIVPWRADKSNRTNPQNGLCLNPLHDRAFDRGLITITSDYKVKASARLEELANNEFVESSILRYVGRQISLPEKFLPDPTFLSFHNEQVFLQ